MILRDYSRGRSMVAKLERVALREAFPSEVKDLSKWVQLNLDELNSATGLSLEARKARNSPLEIFSVDLIAEGRARVQVQS